MSKTKWGIRFKEYEILYYYSAGKKTPCTKRLFLVPKKCFLYNFLFQIFEELMELGDLLGLSLLRIFFIAARSFSRK